MKFKDLPPEIQDVAYEEHVKYVPTAYKRETLIKDDLGLSSLFVYSKTDQGHSFWQAIYQGKYEEFYKRYPKENTTPEPSTYNVGDVVYAESTTIWSIRRLVESRDLMARNRIVYTKPNGNTEYCKGGAAIAFGSADTIRLATISEVLWLEACEKANKFVPRENTTIPTGNVSTGLLSTPAVGSYVVLTNTEGKDCILKFLGPGKTAPYVNVSGKLYKSCIWNLQSTDSLSRTRYATTDEIEHYNQCVEAKKYVNYTKSWKDAFLDRFDGYLCYSPTNKYLFMLDKKDCEKTGVFVSIKARPLLNTLENSYHTNAQFFINEEEAKLVEFAGVERKMWYNECYAQGRFVPPFKVIPQASSHRHMTAAAMDMFNPSWSPDASYIMRASIQNPLIAHYGGGADPFWYSEPKKKETLLDVLEPYASPIVKKDEFKLQSHKKLNIF